MESYLCAIGKAVPNARHSLSATEHGPTTTATGFSQMAGSIEAPIANATEHTRSLHVYGCISGSVGNPSQAPISYIERASALQKLCLLSYPLSWMSHPVRSRSCFKDAVYPRNRFSNPSPAWNHTRYPRNKHRFRTESRWDRNMLGQPEKGDGYPVAPHDAI